MSPAQRRQMVDREHPLEALKGQETVAQLAALVRQ